MGKSWVEKENVELFDIVPTLGVKRFSLVFWLLIELQQLWSLVAFGFHGLLCFSLPVLPMAEFRVRQVKFIWSSSSSSSDNASTSSPPMSPPPLSMLIRPSSSSSSSSPSSTILPSPVPPPSTNGSSAINGTKSASECVFTFLTFFHGTFQ